MQQQNMQQNQQAIMPQPPHVVSVKDSNYLTDMLSWNLLAMKKAHFYAAQCQDQEIIAAIEKTGQMHQRHYQKILGHMQNANQPTQQNQNMQQMQ